MTQIFESKIRSRLGIFRLKIHDTTDTITDQQEAPVRGALQLRVANPQPGYGPAVQGSFAQVEVDDRSGFLRSVFSGGYVETDYLVEIAGPGFLWHGCVRQGLTRRSAAPRVKPGQAQLYLYDRLGALRDVPGSEARPHGVILYSAFAAALPHVDAFVHYGATAANQFEASPEYVWFAEQLGERRGDHGTMREQLETIARLFGLRVFMSCSDGNFYAIERPSVGEEITGAYQTDLSETPIAWTEVTIDADAVSVPAGELDVEGEEGFQELRAARGAQTAGVPRPLVRDGTFQHFEGGSPTLWSSSGTIAQGSSGYVLLGDIGGGGQEAEGRVTQRLLRVSDIDDVFLTVTYDALAQSPGDSTFTHNIVLHGESGTDYWLTDLGLWSETETGQSTFGSEQTLTANDEFPEPGTLRLRAEGVDVEYGNVSADLVHGDDEPIDDWVVIESGDAEDGELVDLGEPLQIQVSPDGTTSLQPAGEWTGRFGTQVRLAGHTVAARLAQQTQDLETLETTALPGLYGPGTRLLVRKPNESSESAFICAGRILDITAGQTEIIDVELPAEVLS